MLEKHLFALWYQVRDGTLAWADFQVAMLPLMAHVSTLLQEGVVGADAKARGTCRNLLKLEPALWTFVWEPGVEPTNNCAERPLRRAVLWRRRSFGTQSEAGSQFVERILTHHLTPTTSRRAGLLDGRLCRRDPQRPCPFALAADVPTSHCSLTFSSR